MKKTFFLLMIVAALGMMSCYNTPKPDNEPTPQPQKPALLSDYDMVIIEAGQMVFYHSASGECLRFTAETDTVYNAIYDSHNTLYYSVKRNRALSLASLKLDEQNPQPKKLADWKLTLDDDPGDLVLNQEENKVAIRCHAIPLYNTYGSFMVYDTQTHDVVLETEMTFDEETGEVEYDDIEFVEKTMPEVDENLFENDSQGTLYYIGGSNGKVCLSNQLNYPAIFNKTQEELNDEAVVAKATSLNPQGTKVLFYSVIPDGIFTHGPYNVVNLDGSNLCTLRTDISFGEPSWLKDGSLVFVLFEGGPDDDYLVEKMHLAIMTPEGTIKDLNPSTNYSVKPF